MSGVAVAGYDRGRRAIRQRGEVDVLTDMADNASGDKRKRVHQQLEEEVFLYEGGEVAKERRSEITRVRIGPHVKDIPGRSFHGCSNLLEVHFNDGLEVVGERAFQRCTALEQVTIPSSVTKLGNHAFNGCTNLVQVQFQEGLDMIGDYAFLGARRCNK